MNLVIDNAVEVKQITKTNDKESRRPLGTSAPFPPFRYDDNLGWN